jgi:putative spermidine/putrescine transport system ATP-binding protein
MQVELKSLQRRLGITFVYVTHDQGEALSMSDRVAVFNQGKLEQVATPRALYEQPRTVFVAGFVGTANILDGAVARQWTGNDRPVSIRPEHMRLGAPPSDHCTVSGKVVDVQFHGPSSRVTIEAAGTSFIISAANDGFGDRGTAASRLAVGEDAQVSWARAAMVELDGPEPA